MYWCGSTYIRMYWCGSTYIRMYWCGSTYIRMYWCGSTYIRMYWCGSTYIRMYWCGSTYIRMLCVLPSCVHCRVLRAENGRVPVMQPRTCVVRNALLQQLVKTSLFWFQPVQTVPQPLLLTACVKCADC